MVERIENDPLVPADLRTRLEAARLENLALMRALDQGVHAGSGFSPGDVRKFAALDADCAEALWALDQSPRGLDVRVIVRDTLASLDRLPAARQRLRDGLFDGSSDLEREILATLDPTEAYSQVPGRDRGTSPRREASRGGEPVRRTAPSAGRNDPCPCGSGRKFKKCCMARSAVQAPLPSTRTRYHFEPGSYGGAGVFVPSIACYRVDDAGSRALHFVLVRPEAPRGEEHAASAAAQADIAAAFAGPPGSPGDSERVALALRSAGYVSVDDPRVVRD